VRDPIRVLVNCGTGQNVDTTIVDGEILMTGGVLTGLDEERVTRESRRAAEIVWQRVPDLDGLSPVSIPFRTPTS
jgi:5-methylthioadenosine/S-adenosylhomocysteine deaminase